MRSDIYTQKRTNIYISGVRTALIYISFCYSVCTGVSIYRSPEKNKAHAFVLTPCLVLVWIRKKG